MEAMMNVSLSRPHVFRIYSLLRRGHRFSAALAVLFLAGGPAFAVINLQNDPNGFHGIQWGASLADRSDLTLADANGDIKGYDLKQGPMPLGEAAIDLMRFIAIEDQFARVAIRYRGKANHDKMLAYLESRFGSIDRTPGHMMRGMNQQYNWRGSETEINLTYEAPRERGYVFIESRILTPRFIDRYPDASY
jgi:hypothetical protein